MVVLAIAGILLSVAVVGYLPVIERTHTEDGSASLRMDLVFSRGEAVKRGGWVGFCGSEDGISCATSFQDGWLVFHDVDRSKTLNSTDTLLTWTRQPHPSVSIKFKETGSSEKGPIMFNYRGYPDRSIITRISKGDATEEFTLHTTGQIEFK